MFQVNNQLHVYAKIHPPPKVIQVMSMRTKRVPTFGGRDAIHCVRVYIVRPPVATSATLPSLHDAGDNAFAEPRGQLVAGAQFLRPAHYTAIDVKRKRVSALQRIFRIEQRKLRANR